MQGKLKDWVTELPDVEERLNNQERSLSKITLNEMNLPDEKGEALRMLDLFQTQRKMRNTFKYQNLSRVESEKGKQKLPILKPLSVGMQVYLPKYKTDKTVEICKSHDKFKIRMGHNKSV